MERANWHTYQVLTKRSSRLRDMLEDASCSSRPAFGTSGGA